MQESTRLIPLESQLLHHVAEVIIPSLESMGFSLVNLKLETGNRKHQTLLVTAETLEGAPVTLDQCAEISRAASALLDVEDIIKERYYLEVSSPGIDRDLVRYKDFKYARGFAVKIKTLVPVEGQQNFRGILRRCSDTDITIAPDDQKPDEAQRKEISIAYDQIKKARLLLTDELIKAKKPQKPEAASAA